MIVKQLPSFSDWLNHLRDQASKYRIVARINRVANGLMGDCHSVGHGVSELRLDFGPGYRIYYTTRNQEIIFLLIGGTKGSQSRDIEKAKSLAKEIP